MHQILQNMLFHDAIAMARSENANWLYSFAKSTCSWYNLTIQGVSMNGNCIGWADECVILFTPHDKEEIYTDSRAKKKVIEHVGQSYCDKNFTFINNWMSEKDIICFKKYATNHRLSRDNVITREYYIKEVELINFYFNQCDKFLKIGLYKGIIIFGELAKNKIKSLKVCMETINYKIKAYLFLSKGYLGMHILYKSIKSMRKGFILNRRLLRCQIGNGCISSDINENMQTIQQLCKRINCYLNYFDLEYILKQNEMIYHHPLFAFYSKGYNIMKLNVKKPLALNNDQLLKYILKKQWKQRCSYCKYLPSAGNKHKKCKCRKVYYCNKYCQKRGWLCHKNFCSQYKF